jgi:hypothetical protein
MKNLKTNVGIISSILIFIGCLFKTLHFPGTGVLLLTGSIVFVAAYIPLLIFSSIKDQENSKLAKFTYSLGYLMSAIFIIGIVFKFLRLQYTLFLMKWSITTLTFIVMPLFFYSIYSKMENGKEKTHKLTQAIITMAIIGLIYTLVDLRFSN